MNIEVTRQFLSVFSEFLSLCRSNSWPTDSTDSTEIRNAYEAAKFLENCLAQLHKRNLVDAFLSQLTHGLNTDRIYTQSLTDPPQYLLKKILRSKINISILDIALTLFIECFDEKRLELCLSKLMLEKASEEVIIEEFLNNVTENDLIKVKCNLLLATLSEGDSSFVDDILEKRDEDITKVILACLTIHETKYQIQLNRIKSKIARVLSDKSSSYKWLWRLLLIQHKDLLVRICCEHSDIFSTVVNAVVDSGKVIKENISSEFYYIDITFSELVGVVRCLCANVDLKDDLVCIVRLADSERTFWDTVLSKV